MLAVTQGAGSSMFDKRRRELITLLGGAAGVASRRDAGGTEEPVQEIEPATKVNSLQNPCLVAIARPVPRYGWSFRYTQVKEMQKTPPVRCHILLSNF